LENRPSRVSSESGFNGATVDRIAELAGMSKPNLHYYFKRKSDVYYTVLEHIRAIWPEYSAGSL